MGRVAVPQLTKLGTAARPAALSLQSGSFLSGPGLKAACSDASFGKHWQDWHMMDSDHQARPLPGAETGR